MLNRDGKPATLVPDKVLDQICDFRVGMNQHLKDIDALIVIVQMERTWRFKPRTIDRLMVQSPGYIGPANLEVVKASDYDELERKLNSVIDLLQKVNGEVDDDFFAKLWMAACPERADYLK